MLTKPPFSDDEEPRVQFCPTNQSLETGLGLPTAVVNWTNPKATDNSRTKPTVTCNVESGSKFGIGETEVLCQAIDPAGNRATCVFTIKIVGKMLFIILNNYAFVEPT